MIARASFMPRLVPYGRVCDLLTPAKELLGAVKWLWTPLRRGLPLSRAVAQGLSSHHHRRARCASR